MRQIPPKSLPFYSLSTKHCMAPAQTRGNCPKSQYQRGFIVSLMSSAAAVIALEQNGAAIAEISSGKRKRTSDWMYQVLTIYLDGHVRSKVLLQPPMRCSPERSLSL